MEHSFLTDIAICIVAAWLLAVGAHLIRQPLILAYLAAGFLIGPKGLGLIQDHATIQTISELGLILLLFMIGLEIDLKKMLGAGKPITVTGACQVLGGALAGVLLFRGLGFPLGQGRLDALYLALATTLSSTVIVVKILYDKREIDTIPGRITLGIAVIQDLFAILFLAVQPRLDHPSLGMVGLSLGRVGVLLGAAFATSRYVLPPLFRAVARLPELVLVGALAWCFLVAGFAGYLGLSREMGALIAGVAISTFPYTLDVVAKTTSLRDFFVTLFFVALGMDIAVPDARGLGWAAVLGLFVLASRALTVFLPLHRMGMGLRASLLPAINLAQISELSLVILALGKASGHVSQETVAYGAYAFVLLAAVSSHAILQSHRIQSMANPWLQAVGFKDINNPNPDAVEHPSAAAPSIFLLGFSWTASSLFEELRRQDPALLEKLCVVDFNPVVHARLKALAVRVHYGDISQRDTLLHAGIDRARLIVCTLPNTVLKGASNLSLLRQLRDLNPSADIIVHAELFEDIPRLYEAGASYVSLPRLVEAGDLLRVVEASQDGLLEELRTAQQRTLAERREVIP